MQGDRLEYGANFMETILSLSQDVQAQIELGKTSKTDGLVGHLGGPSNWSGIKKAQPERLSFLSGSEEHTISLARRLV